MIPKGLRPLLFVFLAAFALACSSTPTDPLPSWNAGPARQAIERFVGEVTTQGPAFVRPAERVAVFDNDGTLWSEQPLYTQFAFALERAAELAKSDPALAASPAVQAAASGDPKRLASLTGTDLLELVKLTHTGMTTEAYQAAAKAWLDTAREPKSQRRYRDRVYQPMLELMDYLRANGFKVFIVSGGDADFMRSFAGSVYGVPPHQVIGSSNATRFEFSDGQWVLMRTDPLSIDDGPAKPSNIALHIGQQPIFAAGNSDGDLQMLQYATSGTGPRLGVIVHHDDAVREYAYDRESHVGRLDEALGEAARSGWTVVSMKNDWETVFPPSP